MSTGTDNLEGFLQAVAQIARQSGAFADVRLEDGRLACQAKASAEPAFYRLEADDGALWVSLVMADRWLSESIEAGLMHSGDKLEELLEEELVDQGYDGKAPPVQHFRSDDMLFTFRSRLPFPPAEAKAGAQTAGQWLLAYEQCFSQLGDMSAEENEE
ncbi:MAG: hypothetical protein R3B57_01970 [Phycisphaerales bacterium]